MAGLYFNPQSLVSSPSVQQASAYDIMNQVADRQLQQGLYNLTAQQQVNDLDEYNKDAQLRDLTRQLNVSATQGKVDAQPFLNALGTATAKANAQPGVLSQLSPQALYDAQNKTLTSEANLDATKANSVASRTNSITEMFDSGNKGGAQIAYKNSLSSLDPEVQKYFGLSGDISKDIDTLRMLKSRGINTPQFMQEMYKQRDKSQADYIQAMDTIKLANSSKESIALGKSQSALTTDKAYAQYVMSLDIPLQEKMQLLTNFKQNSAKSDSQIALDVAKLKLDKEKLELEKRPIASVDDTVRAQMEANVAAFAKSLPQVKLSETNTALAKGAGTSTKYSAEKAPVPAGVAPGEWARINTETRTQQPARTVAALKVKNDELKVMLNTYANEKDPVARASQLKVIQGLRKDILVSQGKDPATASMAAPTSPLGTAANPIKLK